MFVKFKTVTVRNFASFGNKKTTFNYESGFHQIIGENGEGKTSLIIDSITFALFGKPYRDIKISELINRTNKKKLEVEVTFSIENDEYKIKRGLKPDILEITKNDTKVDLLSSKKLTQTEVNKIIGIDYYLFKNVVNLSINDDNKPFMKMSKTEKEVLIESIFNVKIFSDMLKKAKQDRTKINTSLEIKNGEHESVGNELDQYKIQYKRLASSLKTFDQDKSTTIKEINESIKDNANKLSKSAQNIAKGHKAYKKIDTTALAEIQSLVESSKTAIIETSSMLANESARLVTVNADSCPTCEHSLEGNYGDSIKASIKTSISEHNSTIENNKAKLTETRELLDSVNDDIAFNNTLTANLEKAQIKFDSLNELLEGLESRLESEKHREFNFDLESLKTTIKATNKTYKEIKNKLTELSAQALRYKSIITILSQKGVKSYFMNRLIPILNQTTNKFFEKFSLPLYITFDDYLSPKIYELTKPKDAISYNTFSGGESKRIDLSIAFSFIEILRQINNWDTNLLCFDEIIDGKLDERGLKEVLNSIDEVIQRSNKELGVYLISFRDISGVQFNSKWKLYKVDKYSQIEKVE